MSRFEASSGDGSCSGSGRRLRVWMGSGGPCDRRRGSLNHGAQNPLRNEALLCQQTAGSRGTARAEGKAPSVYDRSMTPSRPRSDARPPWFTGTIDTRGTSSVRKHTRAQDQLKGQGQTPSRAGVLGNRVRPSAAGAGNWRASVWDRKARIRTNAPTAQRDGRDRDYGVLETFARPRSRGRLQKGKRNRFGSRRDCAGHLVASALTSARPDPSYSVVASSIHAYRLGSSYSGRPHSLRAPLPSEFVSSWSAGRAST